MCRRACVSGAMACRIVEVNLIACWLTNQESIAEDCICRLLSPDDLSQRRGRASTILLVTSFYERGGPNHDIGMVCAMAWVQDYAWHLRMCCCKVAVSTAKTVKLQSCSEKNTREKLTPKGIGCADECGHLCKLAWDLRALSDWCTTVQSSIAWAGCGGQGTAEDVLVKAWQRVCLSRHGRGCGCQGTAEDVLDSSTPL